MISHILKIVWRARKGVVSIFVEQALVFVALMLLVVAVFTAAKKYAEPGLPDTRNVAAIGYSTAFPDGVKPDMLVMEETYQKMSAVIDNLKKHSSVVAITEGVDFAPYMRGDEYYYADSAAVGSKKFKVYVKGSDPNGQKVFRLDVTKGLWLSNSKLEDGSIPVVVTQLFADSAGWRDPIGRQITVRQRTGTVVGVLSAMKHHVFTQPVAAVIVPHEVLADIYKRSYREIFVRHRPDEAKIFSSAFYKEFKRLIDNESILPTMANMGMAKGYSQSEKKTELVLQLLPTSFLLLFAFIGTFGIFLLRSRRRVREYALRIALGSTKRGLMLSVIFEALALTLIAALPGMLLAAFIYEPAALNLAAVAATLGVMLLFSTFSAWYPAWRAARVNPAEALHYE